MAAKCMEKEEAKKPMQQGTDDLIDDYYDILVIGRTGMGKSTTVDKLLIAMLEGMERPQAPGPGPAPDEAEQQENGMFVKTFDGRKLTHGDMNMWLIADEDFELDKVSIRLKNLVFFRSLEDSHKEINTSRESNMHVYASTTQCELLSNETTKVRVLDVPGFFGREAQGAVGDLEERALAINRMDLSVMRKVLRIKGVHGLNFRRVVYFLPERGCLKRTSHNLILEVGIMEKYFGRAIFDNMVVVATLSPDTYELIDDTKRNIFADSKIEKSRGYLQEAIREIFKEKCDEGDIPSPPVIFVSLFDTCEEVLRKVQSARVRKEQVQLELSRSVCSRCGVKIYKEGKEEAKATFVKQTDQSGAITDEESTCHPMMVPKYSRVAKFFGGIAHLVTLRRFVGRWPSFESMDEECINTQCKQPPGSHGCMQVGSTFLLCEQEIVVGHSTSAFEPYQIEARNADGEPFQPPAAPGGPRGARPGSSSSSGGTDVLVCSQNGYVYQDGRVLFQQQVLAQDDNVLPMDIKGT